MKIGTPRYSATAIPFTLHPPTVNKHDAFSLFLSRIILFRKSLNDGSPRSTGSSRTHCKFAISGFNSVVITFVAHIYSREMFRYGASCNALYLSGYLQCYFLRDKVAKYIYVLGIIYEYYLHRKASLILYYNLLNLKLIYDICLSIKFIVFKRVFTSFIFYRMV